MADRSIAAGRSTMRRLFASGVILSVLLTPSWALGRKFAAEYDYALDELEGREVGVAYLKDVRAVRQARLDLCWAAALEQALVHQGVDIDQQEIVKLADLDSKSKQSISEFGWHQMLNVFESRLRDGKKVWVLTQIDGWAELAPILSDRTFARKLFREISAKRITLVGIRGEGGGGHVVTVTGIALKRVEGRESRRDDVVGFLIYDPLTGEGRLVSVQWLFRRFVAVFYVTTHKSYLRAVAAQASSTKNVW